MFGSFRNFRVLDRDSTMNSEKFLVTCSFEMLSQQSKEHSDI